jgi:hypothetical protein
MISPHTQLTGLLDLLKISTKGAILRDNCGDLRIEGKNGHIYPDGDGFLLYLCFTDHPRTWTFAKKILVRHRVTQDGEDEGCIHINPSAAEGRTIRELLGVRKRHSADQALRLRGFQFKGSRDGTKPTPR